MNICGVLVHANPAKTTLVAAALIGIDGVEVHETTADGRIVVTVEDVEGTAAIDTLSAIHRLDGVVAASLVYHHFDADADGAADNLQRGSP